MTLEEAKSVQVGDWIRVKYGTVYGDLGGLAFMVLEEVDDHGYFVVKRDSRIIKINGPSPGFSEFCLDHVDVEPARGSLFGESMQLLKEGISL